MGASGDVNALCRTCPPPPPNRADGNDDVGDLMNSARCFAVRKRLDGELGVTTTVDPSIAVYNSDSGRVVATTVQGPTGRSSTSVRSATPVRTVGALRSLITSLERRSLLDDHLVRVSAQPIGSSGVRLPFVSNGGV